MRDSPRTGIQDGAVQDKKVSISRLARGRQVDAVNMRVVAGWHGEVGWRGMVGKILNQAARTPQADKNCKEL